MHEPRARWSRFPKQFKVFLSWSFLSLDSWALNHLVVCNHFYDWANSPTYHQLFAFIQRAQRVRLPYGLFECLVRKPPQRWMSQLTWCQNSLLPIVMRHSLAASHFKVVDESSTWLGMCVDIIDIFRLLGTPSKILSISQNKIISKSNMTQLIKPTF